MIYTSRTRQDKVISEKQKSFSSSSSEGKKERFEKYKKELSSLLLSYHILDYQKRSLLCRQTNSIVTRMHGSKFIQISLCNFRETRDFYPIELNKNGDKMDK
jgi:hypothetical protein